MVEEKKTRWCKICGVTSPKDGRILSEIGVSAIGLMFYQDSDRYVSYAVSYTHLTLPTKA